MRRQTDCTYNAVVVVMVVIMVFGKAEELVGKAENPVALGTSVVALVVVEDEVAIGRGITGMLDVAQHGLMVMMGRQYSYKHHHKGNQYLTICYSSEHSISSSKN